MQPDIPHNPLKLPFFVVCAIAGLAMIVTAFVEFAWGWAILGACLVVVCVAAIVTIRRGENPPWLHSPLDRWFAQRRARR